MFQEEEGAVSSRAAAALTPALLEQSRAPVHPSGLGRGQERRELRRSVISAFTQKQKALTAGRSPRGGEDGKAEK